MGAGAKDVKNAWRLLFALGVVPSILQLCMMHFLPESPRVMIVRGKDKEALDIFHKIYSKATPEILDLKFSLAKSYVAATTEMQQRYSFVTRSKRLWTHKPYRRAIISVSGLQIICQLTGFNTLLYYSGTLFGLLGFSNAGLAGLIPSALNAFFGVSDPLTQVRLMMGNSKVQPANGRTVPIHVGGGSCWPTTIDSDLLPYHDVWARVVRNLGVVSNRIYRSLSCRWSGL